MSYSPIPALELMEAAFDSDYTEMKKEENLHILSYVIKYHIADNYSNHLKLFTDGSVSENEQACVPWVNTDTDLLLRKKASHYFLQN